MAARIRLKRIGRRNRPSYRICVFDARTRRDGPPIEELGSYDPKGKGIDEKVRLNKERALYWLSVGALPTDTVKSFFRKLGVRKGQPLAAAPLATAPLATAPGSPAAATATQAEST